MRFPYFIDTSSLTQAHRVYYPFDIAPSFWNFMKTNFINGNFILINKVKDEIDWSSDDLTNWLHTEIPSSLLLNCHVDPGIMTHYGSIMVWGNGHPQFNNDAKAVLSEFDNADPFIVAASLAKSGIVVSQEVSAPFSKKNIKIPDVCSEFGIQHIDTFTLLRKFGFTM
jgi:hypothetical protein